MLPTQCKQENAGSEDVMLCVHIQTMNYYVPQYNNNPYCEDILDCTGIGSFTPQNILTTCKAISVRNDLVFRGTAGDAI